MSAPGTGQSAPAPRVPGPTPGRWRPLSRWTLRGRVTALASVLFVLVALAWTVAGVAQHSLQTALHAQSTRILPAREEVEALEKAVLNQDLAVRGIMIGGSAAKLSSYTGAVSAERQAEKRLVPLLAGEPELAGAVLRTERAATRWREDDASRAIALARAGVPARTINARLAPSSLKFQAVLDSLGPVDSALGRAEDRAAAQVKSASDTLGLLIFLAGIVTVLGSLGSVLLLRRWVTRPILELRDEIAVVAEGELHHPVTLQGPPEIAEVASDVEGMRRLIVEELERLRLAQEEIARQAEELRRSNGDLEQFAYVASHDLQEPLRKVSSFCELLERRYGDQLDERGRQYLELAADGARRMQALVRDVLSLARIGRMEHRLVTVDLGEALRQALANLSDQAAEVGLLVRAEGLPAVPGDPTLAVALLQNLLTNSMKFRSEVPPEVEISAWREGDHWHLRFADNGIGIDPAYAERVFVIFQRLHGRDEYGGTGIGLALCRRIVEFHGGRIWLDTATGGGAAFRWTWPVAGSAGVGSAGVGSAGVEKGAEVA